MGAFENLCSDHVEKRLNIHDFLVEQEDSTFFATLNTQAMRDIGLLPKDVAVINSAAIARVGDIVMAVVDGEFTIRQLVKTKNNTLVLQAANPDFKPIEIARGKEFEIWGVVTGAFRKYSR